MSQGIALVLGATLGLGLWLLTSRIPMLARPRLMHRVAPYVLDVSPGARELLARRRVDPFRILGAVGAPVSDRFVGLFEGVLGSRDAIAMRLRQARSPMDLAAFRARQLLWSVIGAAGGIVAGIGASLRGAHPVVCVALAIVCAAIGLLGADWWLQRKATRRLSRISDELPTVLELMTLSIAAGESLGDAIRRVASVGNGALAQEFRLVVADMASGTPLTKSLDRLATELAHGPLTRAIEHMRGAIERGTPLVATLQAQAQDTREAAKRQLMESAGKKEISMLVPLVFGLLPITVAFALWPGLYVLQVGF